MNLDASKDLNSSDFLIQSQPNIKPIDTLHKRSHSTAANI